MDLENLKQSPLMWDDTFERELETYLKAVEQNVGRDDIHPLPGRAIVQLMPEIEMHRGLFLVQHADQAQNPEDLKIKMRFGTVLATGRNIDPRIEVGDDVMFSSKLGVKYGGMHNPISLEDGASLDWADEIRVLRMRPDHPMGYEEIWGILEYDLIGETHTYKDFDGEEKTGEVIDESVLLGGIAKIDPDNGEKEPFWIPTERLTTYEEGVEGEPTEGIKVGETRSRGTQPGEIPHVDEMPDEDEMPGPAGMPDPYE